MKGRKHRETGGANQADEDLKAKPMRYTADSKVNGEAEERKSGGRARCKAGGTPKKHVGEVKGEAPKARADRKPRKNGGRTGSNATPFSTARHGTPAPGRKVEMEME